MADWGPRLDHWALKGVSFPVMSGEAFALIGRNGSGKSTLLRLLAGVTYPTSGSVSIARRVSGLLTLGEGFHPLLSGEENAVTQAILSGLTRRQAVARLSEIAAFAELEEYMDQPLRTFSDGMRLRLGFAVAINVDPEVLLIDEVLAVGDLGFRQKCFDYIDDLKASGVTIVMASHDLGQVRRMCDGAVWLAHGKVRCQGEGVVVAESFEKAMRDEIPRRQVGGVAKERFGSGEVEIARVRLLDAGDQETQAIRPGAAVCIEIDFVAHSAVPDAVFVASVHGEHDKALRLDVSTAGDGHAVGRLNGRGTIRLDVERLDLTEGAYWVDAGVYGPNWDRPYDYLWEALPFEVARLEAAEVLTPPRSWSLR
ncbi:MAG: ABC transporter ATP-binding protein [Actinobacteria bacterium]|nr:ABC transporter ATP-binding protein [Actinomycetota bacterium]